jgi:ethanolamine utilization cobalamin adenosyltransferase
MLLPLEAVRDNIRNRDGKRVFYMAKGDLLTSDARDFLTRERIEILPAETARPERYKLLNGGYVEEKPEHMTHLHGDVLVEKTHPRILFRGAVDTLEAEILLCQLAIPALRTELQEVLQLARELLRSEVLEQPFEEATLGGMDAKTLREHSHRPQDFYGQMHFMPSASDTEAVLRLNRLRTLVRATELKAVAALPERTDILRAFNRMSSYLYILMIREKATNTR